MSTRIDEGLWAWKQPENNNHLIELQNRLDATPADASIELAYFGGSAFRITAPSGLTMMIDPWRNPPWGNWDWYLYDFPRQTVDIALSTHAHFDHDGVHALSAGIILDRLAGRFSLADVTITGIADKHVSDSSHNAFDWADKTRRLTAIKTDPPDNWRSFDNALLLVEVAGLRILHWGDNRPNPPEAVWDRIGEIDIALLPVDGSRHVLSDAHIGQITARLGAKVVVPHHYYIWDVTTRGSTLLPPDDWVNAQPNHRWLTSGSLRLGAADVAGQARDIQPRLPIRRSQQQVDAVDRDTGAFDPQDRLVRRQRHRTAAQPPRDPQPGQHGAAAQAAIGQAYQRAIDRAQIHASRTEHESRQHQSIEAHGRAATVDRQSSLIVPNGVDRQAQRLDTAVSDRARHRRSRRDPRTRRAGGKRHGGHRQAGTIRRIGIHRRHAAHRIARSRLAKRRADARQTAACECQVAVDRRRAGRPVDPDARPAPDGCPHAAGARDPRGGDAQRALAVTHRDRHHRLAVQVAQGGGRRVRRRPDKRRQRRGRSGRPDVRDTLDNGGGQSGAVRLHRAVERDGATDPVGTGDRDRRGRAQRGVRSGKCRRDMPLGPSCATVERDLTLRACRRITPCRDRSGHQRRLARPSIETGGQRPVEVGGHPLDTPAPQSTSSARTGPDSRGFPDRTATVSAAATCIPAQCPAAIRCATAAIVPRNPSSSRPAPAIFNPTIPAGVTSRIRPSAMSRSIAGSTNGLPDEAGSNRSITPSDRCPSAIVPRSRTRPARSPVSRAPCTPMLVSVSIQSATRSGRAGLPRTTFVNR